MQAALTIAGSDSGGGAGIQADIKTFAAFGVFGTSAITAITAQNTCTVAAVEPVSHYMIRAQIEAVLGDIAISAIKIGMLPSPEAICAVAEALRGTAIPIVLDPVMIAKSGDVLLPPSAIGALRTHLIPLATVLTPNVPEAEQLGGDLLSLGVRHVLMKGGHAQGATCIDTLIGPEPRVFTAPRIDTRNTHGTGCSLSSAIAAGLALGMTVPEAVARAHAWLHQAIFAADTLGIGKGHGPVHHFHAGVSC